jgi:3-hydroxyisobutyrate dehydrogenase-like beta-hydroxyacid dehydrogenase
MERLRCGIIGFGEAGSAFARQISKGLKRRVLITDPLLNRNPLPRYVQERLQGLRVDMVPAIPRLVKSCDVVISLVTPAVASSVAVEAGKTRSRALFIDFNSISPTEKQACSRLFVEGTFVDGAILGSIGGEGATTPLALAGPCAKRASTLLRSAGLRVSVISTKVGEASALKICRSIFMKGVESLLIETLLAANEFRMTEPVLRSIEQTFNSYGLRSMVHMLVTTHAVHCRRRASEMQSAMKMMDEIGIPGRMCKAARDVLAASSRTGLTDHFGDVVPKNCEAVIKYLRAWYRGMR